jgi:hypothetical protein
MAGLRHSFFNTTSVSYVFYSRNLIAASTFGNPFLPVSPANSLPQSRQLVNDNLLAL